MTSQLPYGQPPPQNWPGYAHTDPQAPGTQILPPPAAPAHARQSLAGVRTLSVLACVLGIAAILFAGYKTGGISSSGQVSHLKSQVASLETQVTQITSQDKNLQHQVTTLAAAQGTLSGTVGGMTTTVRNLAPYSKAVCSLPAQGTQGAFTAVVPCNPK